MSRQGLPTDCHPEVVTPTGDALGVLLVWILGAKLRHVIWERSYNCDTTTMILVALDSMEALPGPAEDNVRARNTQH